MTAWLAADPYGDPLRVDWAAAWRLHAQRLAGRGYGKDAFRQEAESFLEALAAVIGGGLVGDIAQRAERLGLDGRWKVDQLMSEPPDEVAECALMARIAVDIAPSVGNDGPERILGPWTLGLDASRSEDRAVLLAALAASCFVEVDEDPHERTPFMQWVRRKPHPPMDVRETVRAVEHATPGAWRIDAIGPDGWVLHDLVGIVPRAVPRVPVRVVAASSVQGPAVPGDLLLARVVPTTSGPVVPFGFTLRGCPEPERIRTWIRAESWVRRLDQKLPSLEGMLREWPHTLWRRAHEWAWVR